MLVIIAYDVNVSDKNGSTRLRHLSKACLDYGQRVQNSVFECNVDYGTFVKLKNNLLNIIDKEKDSVRFYLLGNNWKGRIEHYGIKPSINFEGPLII